MTRSKNAPPPIDDVLCELITTGRISPGSWLREDAIAKEFGVSRTPIREACNRLVNQGVLERFPRRGFRACALERKELEDVYPIVVSLEVLGIRSLAEPTADLVSQLESMNFKKNQYPKTASEFYKIDRAWHARLVKASANAALIHLHAQLNIRLAKYIFAYWKTPVDPTRSSEEHQLICDAIRRDDIDLACELVRSHRRMGLQRIRSLMKEGTTPA